MLDHYGKYLSDCAVREVYKIAYKTKYFGKLQVYEFENKADAINFTDKIHNQFFTLYDDKLNDFQSCWAGKKMKNMPMLLLARLSHPLVTRRDILKYENKDLYSSIPKKKLLSVRLFMLFRATALLCYASIILIWLFSTETLSSKLFCTTIILLVLIFNQRDFEEVVLIDLNKHKNSKNKNEDSK